MRGLSRGCHHTLPGGHCVKQQHTAVGCSLLLCSESCVFNPANVLNWIVEYGRLESLFISIRLLSIFGNLKDN